MSNRAWVTLATNDSYGLGALVLAHSLRRANTAHPAVVLITPSVTEAMRNRLSAVFAEVITVNVLDSQDAAHLALLQRPELGITFTKIHCWTLTQYQKCVFLDADTLIVQNCDELFEREELSAAPDVGWPDCFNSGVFVFVPSQETYTRLITFAQERGSFDGGDQGLLNAFFSDWAHGDINKHLPFLYNVTSAAFYSYIPALKHYGQDVKIIHFIGAAKPWLQQYNWQSHSVDAPEHLQQFLQLWWDVFVSQVHCQLDAAMESAVDEEQGPLEPPSESPPEDSQHHYAPEVTADSEFPWHWPDTSIQETENQEHHVNMSEIHDPWEHYRGTIPPQQKNSEQNSNFGDVQNEEQIRKYAWEYQGSYDQNARQQKEHYQHLEQHSHHHVSYTQHHHPQYDIHQKHQHQNVNTHYHHQENQTHHQDADHNWQNQFNQNNSNFNLVGSHQESIEHQPWYSQNSQSQQEHLYSEQKSHQFFKSNQLNDNSNNYHYDQRSHSNSDNSHTQESRTHVNQNINNYEQQYNQNNVDHHSVSHIAPDDYSEIRFSRQHNGYKHFIPYINQIIIDQVYHVHLDHRPRRNRRRRRLDCDHVVCAKGLASGHISDSESEEEYIIPRHPYDGFYLRHRPTIDPRGRKICTHEIPPTPLPSPPPEEPSSLESSPGSSEEYDTASECEDQYSGVAGNLARVVPGSSSFQNEAIDELTRRQGWEAGNIDYMGADSFDNIWAKISQTLSQQPPKQPSPPRKEPTPPKEPTAPKEPSPLEQSAPPATSPVVPEAAPVSSPASAPASVPSTKPAATTTPEDLKAEAPVAPALEAPKTETHVAPAVEASKIVALVGPAVKAPKTEAPGAPAVESAKNEAPAAVPAVPPKSIQEVLAAQPPKGQPTQKTEAKVPPTPPATPKSTPEATTPVTETVPDAPKAIEPFLAKPASPAVAAEAHAAPVPEKPAATPEKPVAAPAKPAATPEKPQDSSVTTTLSTDSPPLANTPSKEDSVASVVSPTKLEERRKHVEKLQLSPPAAADLLPTPDSELEDAAALAHAIIASELSTSVTASTPAADISPTPPLQDKRLSAEAPEIPSPPVSLAQIGVKPKGKPTTAAQIESSIAPAAEAAATPESPASSAPAASESSAPATPSSPTTPAHPSEAGKKKSVKKATKKEAGPSGDTPTPVPPPRKKEKKPKEK